MPAKGQDIMPNARSIYLAKLAGPVMLAVGIALIANTAALRAMANEVVHSEALIFISGILSMVAGLAIVIAHNDWTPDWRLIITLLGWLAAIGGALRVIAPQVTQHVGGSLLAHAWAPVAVGALYFVLGAVLSYFGYPELWALAEPQRPRRRSRR
jgi:hypothetical protein